jgi:hypothetical protein
MSTNEVSKFVICKGCQTIDNYMSVFVSLVMGTSLNWSLCEVSIFATHGKHGLPFARTEIEDQQLQWLNAQAWILPL